MPRGPNGEWRPAEPIARAVHVARIATGQIEETFEPPQRHAGSDETRDRAVRAGKARAASQSPEERSELAKAAAKTRWGATT